MENQEQFLETIGRLKEKGFVLPRFEYNRDDDSWEAILLNEGIEDINYGVGLMASFSLSYNQNMGLEDVIKNNITSIDEIGFFDYHCDHDSMWNLLEPEEWKDIPERIDRQYDELQLLSNFLNNFSQSERDARRDAYKPNTFEETVGEHYGELIRDDRLIWANILGEKFPYVRTTFDDFGDVGRAFGGLYFISTDIANEPWKEQIVAYHERFCDGGNHEYALKKERELAKKLGKEKELSEWRKLVIDLWINGGER
jgi:hypothetical protein